MADELPNTPAPGAIPETPKSDTQVQEMAQKNAEEAAFQAPTPNAKDEGKKAKDDASEATESATKTPGEEGSPHSVSSFMDKLDAFDQQSHEATTYHGGGHDFVAHKDGHLLDAATDSLRNNVADGNLSLEDAETQLNTLNAARGLLRNIDTGGMGSSSDEEAAATRSVVEGVIANENPQALAENLSTAQEAWEIEHRPTMGKAGLGKIGDFTAGIYDKDGKATANDVAPQAKESTAKNRWFDGGPTAQVEPLSLAEAMADVLAEIEKMMNGIMWGDGTQEKKQNDKKTTPAEAPKADVSTDPMASQVTAKTGVDAQITDGGYEAASEEMMEVAKKVGDLVVEAGKDIAMTMGGA